MIAPLHSQEVTVIRDYGGKRMVSDPSQYKLVGSSEHTVLIQHYELISEKDRNELVDIIIQNIDFYLDQVMEFSDGKMTVRKSNKQILKDLNLIVENNIRLYEYQVDTPFEGFSQDFVAKIDRIAQLSWDASRVSDGTSTFNSEQMAYNYVQAQIASLKDISSTDLLTYADAHIHEHTGNEFQEDFAGLSTDMDTSEWTVHSPLPAINYELTTMNNPDIGMYIEPAIAQEEIPKGADKRIVELLETNNRMISEFSKQMLSMQEEMIAMRREGLALQKDYSGMRDDISDLQVAMREIQEGSQSIVSDPGLRPLESEKNYVVRFNKNSDELSLPYRMELNEVYHLLMIDPTRKVLLTGFADISGNPEINAAISRKRALAVKSYLAKKGISTTRMIVNYIGDAASTSVNPQDRKVEIAWLGN